MADPTEKKPGRDITDLKARLGLQRPVTPAPQPATPAPAAAADARRDPFAAPARPAVAYQQPEVITDAGPPVHVEAAKKRHLGTWIKLAAVIVFPSAFFFFYGGVYNARLLHNKTIDDAGQIQDQVEQIRKRSQLIYDALTKSFQRAKMDPDMQLVEDLKALEPLTPPKTDKIFRTNYAYLEGLTIERLFGYYNDTVLLYASVTRFHGAAERMKEDLEKAMSKAQEASMTNYGIVIDPSGPIPIGNLVIVGQAICPDRQPECPPDTWIGMKVKASPTSSWTDKQLAGEDYQRVIPLAPDKPLAQQALIGSAESTALLSYRGQLTEIRAISKRLIDAEKDLLKELGEAAGKGKVFTF